jgi:uncharacterized protein
MLRKIKILPLASESFGVRSMCTMVETPDLTMVLDAGISLTPYRFNLPPHPIEFQTIDRLRKTIAQAADKASVTTISHYHFDHHTPSFKDWLVNWTTETETARQIYQGKTVLLKNPKEKINASQRQRAWMFEKTSGKYVKTLKAADGQTFNFGNTIIRFSEAVAHGSEDSMLGWVVMATIQFEEERFMFAPDIQGPMSNRTLQLILSEAPDAVMLGGPPLYLGGFRVDWVQLEQGLTNLTQIVKAVPLVIMEHHVLRGEDWKLKTNKIFEEGQSLGHKVFTAAEFLGKENLLLESNRKNLYRDYPPTEKFEQWVKTLRIKKIEKPPI